VYSALQQADTVGLFQVESRAQMSCLPRLRPQRFYDIVVQVAIIRPGPIVGQMVNPFLQRRQGREDVTYPHPTLEPVLKRTLGVPLFQEQLLRLAMIAANFSGGEAEELRRAMGFKRSQARMKEIEAKLRAGMTHNGIPAKAQEEIILSITSFALYGFPESHAASFALIAYASAYLKCHYLAAFTAALLNNQPMGFYSPATIVKDAQRHGLRMLPVDVMRSEWNCTLETVVRGQGPGASKTFVIPTPKRMRGAEESQLEKFPNSDFRFPIETTPFASQSTIHNQQSTISKIGNRKSTIESSFHIALRLGLRYVRGLREEAAQALVRERLRAPFASIHDLARRVPELRKDELTTLAEIGALNTVARGQRPGASKTFVIPTPERERGAEESGEFPITDFRFPIETNPSVSQSTIKNQQSTIASTIGNRKSSIGNCFHRRDALWQVERAVRSSGPLLEQQREPDAPSPLQPMNHEERLVADFHGTGLTVGPHPWPTAAPGSMPWAFAAPANCATCPAAGVFASEAASSPASARAPPKDSSSSAWKMKPAWPTPSSHPTCFIRTACSWPASVSWPSKAFCRIRTTSSPSEPSGYNPYSSPKPKPSPTTSISACPPPLDACALRDKVLV